MANATVKTETEIVTTEVKVKRVHLVLSVEEAQALRDVLSRIGGHSTNTRRGLTSAVNYALGEAGYLIHTGTSDLTGEIHFKEM